MVEAEAASLVRTAITEFGRLDGAFNNAGSVYVTGPVHEIDGEAWREDLGQNLTSVFYCMKAEIPAMLESPTGGSIVNNASTGAVTGISGMSSYAAAKHGVIGLTRSAALECATQGLRVNALVIGNVGRPTLEESPMRRQRHLPRRGSVPQYKVLSRYIVIYC